MRRARTWWILLFCLSLVCAGGASASVTEAEAQGANAPPVAKDNEHRVMKGGTLRIPSPGVLRNDLDPDGDQLTAARASAPRHGRLDLRSGGSFVYKPDEGYRGKDSFTYRATDPSGASDTATVEITVWSPDRLPLARNNAYAVGEDGTLTVPAPGVLRNDAEADGRRLSATKVTDPGHGSLSLDRAGSFAYTPEKDFSGEDSFVYRATDNRGRNDEGTVTIAVGAVNDAPVFTGAAGNTSQTIDEGAELAALEATDADGDTLTFELTGGSLPPGITLGGDGHFAGAAGGRAAGSYTANIKVSDGDGETDTTDLAVTVNPVEEASLVDDSDVTTDEDVAKTITLTATDADTDSLTFSVGEPGHGSLGTASAPDCATSAGTTTCTMTVVYTPDADYNGPDSFTYTAGDSGQATVSITVNAVNDEPVARADDKSTPENTPLVFPASDLVANDSRGAANEDAQTLTVTEVKNPQHGTVVLENGEITFTPTTDYNGPAGFDYTVCDSGSPQGCSTQTAAVDVTVSPVNSRPVAQDGTETTEEDADPIQVDLGALVSDVETSDANLAYTIVTGPTPQQGTLTGNGPSFAFDSADDFDGEVEISYKVTDRGDPDNCAAPGAGCAAARDSETKTVTITVDPANDPPRNIALSSSNVDENEPAGTPVGALSSTDPDAGDTHSYALVAGAGSDDNDQFTVSGDELETAASFDRETKSSYTIRVRSTDSASESFEKQFTITVDNVNEASTDVTLSPSSVDENEPSGTDVGTLSTIDPDAGDTFTYALVAGTGSDDNGKFAVSGDKLQTAARFDHETKSDYTVRVRSTDGGGHTTGKALAITVADANDAPTATDDTGTTDEDTILNVSAPGVLGNDTDVDAGDTSTVGKLNGSTTLTGTSAKGATVTMNANGSYTYDPGSVFQSLLTGQDDTDTFTYNAKDAGGLESNAATVTITIDGVTDPPVISSGGTLDYRENDEPTPVDGGLSVTHPEGARISEATVKITGNYGNGQDVLAFIDNNAGDGISQAGSFDSTTGELKLTGNATAAQYQAALKSVTYENTSEDPSTDTRSVTFKATDVNATESTPATRGISVTPVDDPPVAVNDSATVLEDADATDVPVLGNDTDVDEGPKTIDSIATQPTNGTVAITGGGTGLTYKPNTNYCNYPPTSNLDTFTYRLNGGSPATVSMTVTCVNDAPVAGTDSWETFGNTELRVDLDTSPSTPHISDTTTNSNGTLQNDNDPVENDSVSVAGIAGCSDDTSPYDCTVSGAKVLMRSDGTFSFTPAPGASSGTFQYTLKDSGGRANGGDDDATGTVNLTLHEKIWYVDPNAGSGGNGTSNSPLSSFGTTLNGSGGSGDSDVANDYIFVYDGTLNGSVELEAGQHLLGEGVGLSINRNLNGNGAPTDLVGQGIKPQINGSSDAVKATQAMPAEIRGLSLSGGASANAIDLTATGSYGGSSTLTISDNTVTAAGAEGMDINLGATGTAALAIHDNTVTSTGTALDVNRTAGTAFITRFDDNAVGGNTGGSGVNVVGGVTFDATPGGAFQTVSGGATAVGASGNGVGGHGVSLSSVSGDLRFDDLDVVASAGNGLFVQGTDHFAGSSGTRVGVTAPADGGSSTITATGGAAVNTTSLTLDLRLETAKSTNGTSNGLGLGNTTGTFSAGSSSEINNAGGADVLIASSPVAFSYAGTITDDQGRLVEVSETTAPGSGAKTFSGAITDGNDGDGSGILLNNNDAATVNFTGGLTLSTGANAAFTATNGGTVNVTGANNTIASTTGTALKVENTSIGSDDLTFQSISANGATNGIVLNNTGTSGGLSVTGDGSTANSGGIIQNTAGPGGAGPRHPSGQNGNAAVMLTNTANVSLKFMKVLAPKGNGILADDIKGTGNVIEKSVVDYNNTVIPNAFGLRWESYGTSADAALTLDATTFQNKGDGTTAVSLSAMGQATNGSKLTFNVKDSNTGDSFESKYTNLFGSGIVAGSGDTTGSTARVAVNVSDTKFVNAWQPDASGNPTTGGLNNLEFGVQASALLDLQVINNTFDDIGRPLANVGVINVNSNDTGQLGTASSPARIAGNTIRNVGFQNASFTGGYMGMRFGLQSNAPTTHRLVVANNQLLNLINKGILLSSRDKAIVNARIDNSAGAGNPSGVGNTFGTVASPVGQNNQRAIDVDASDTTTMKLSVQNNPSIVNDGSSSANSALSLTSGIENNTGNPAATFNSTVVGNVIKNVNATAGTGGRFRARTVPPDGGTNTSNMCLDLRSNQLEDGSKTFDLVHGSNGTFSRNTAGNTGSITQSGAFSTVGSCPQPDF